jgi:O-antigen/teichoic acid export membrane protein
MQAAILKNTFWLFSEKIVLMSCGLILSVLCARLLGPERFGDYSYLLALIAFIVPLSSFGLNSLLVKEQIRLQADLNVIYSSAFFIRSVGALICTLCIVLIISLSNLGVEAKIGGAFFALSYLLSGFQVTVFYFQATHLNRKISTIRMSMLVIFLVFKIIILFITAKLEHLLILMAVESLILFLTYSYALNKKNVYISYKYFDLGYALSLVKKSFWLFLSGIAAILYLKIDQVMLMAFQGPIAVGTYAVAAKISEVWFFFPEAFMAAVFPILLKQNRSDMNKTLQVCLDILVLLAVILVILTLIFADALISTLYGADYVASIPILKLHIIGCLFVFTRAVVSKWLIINDFYRYSLLSHGFGAVINITLNLFLIPSFGGIGAAYATVISYACASFVVFAFINPARPIFKQQLLSYVLIPSLGFRYWRKH